MLQKLARRLTLVNVAVSCAILFVMAAAALGVTEGMIISQQEKDLAMYTRMAAPLAREVEASGLAVFLQTPEKYTVYLENEAGEGRIVSQGSPLTAEAVRAMVEPKRKELSEHLSETTDETKTGNRNAVFTQQIIGTTQALPEEGVAAPGSLLIGRVAQEAVRATIMMNQYLTGRSGSASYRYTAVSVDVHDSQYLVLILQDRADELTSRYNLRWLFSGSIAFGLCLIVLASLYISSRSIRPIEQSILQQRAFVAAASHELRTPVAALRANAEVLSDAPLGEYAPYLESIASVGERMSQLIGDLIDLARADAGELSVQEAPMDAETATEKALQWMRPLADARGVSVIDHLSPAEMLGDPDRLRQVLLALLDNALRYTPTGGQIEVCVTREKSAVLVTVSDTGIGIADEHKPFVFDRFYRADAARSRDSGGAGLGLSVARQLVEQMGGTIAIEDNPDGGTVVLMRFRAL